MTGFNQMGSPMHLHAPHHYDRYYHLKVPFILWLLFIYGAAHFLSLLSRVRELFGTWIEVLADWRLALMFLPLLSVMVAAGCRVPESGRYMRLIWKNGRALLLVSYLAATSVYVMLRWPVLAMPHHDQFHAAALALGFDVLALAYLLRSRFLTDLFDDYPEPAESQTVGQLEPSAHALPELPKSAEACHAQGLRAVERNNLIEAAAYIQRAAALDTNNALYQRNLCEVFRRLGKLGQAIRAGKAATRLAPEDADAHYNLALALSDARHPDDALMSYREAVSLNPAYAEAWNNCGVLLRQMGHPDAARQAFEAALAVQPDHANARLNLKSMDK